jgi:hypothetical protein
LKGSERTRSWHLVVMLLMRYRNCGTQMSNGKQSILKCRPEEPWRNWSVLYHRSG